MIDIIAIIACRDEDTRIGNCLAYLQENGIRFAVIDDGSSDETREIIHRSEFRRSLVHYERRESDEVFRLSPLLTRKVELARELSPDWIIHHDADEIMHSYQNGETLAQAIERIAATGANVINLDEFVFLPLDHFYFKDNVGPQPMRSYYFFEPNPVRLMRIWKPEFGASIVLTGGHQIVGNTHRLATETFALRHYIFRDQAHAFNKYESRLFDPNALEKGWHLNRVNQEKEKFKFPPAALLRQLGSPADRALDKSDPKRTHYWQW